MHDGPSHVSSRADSASQYELLAIVVVTAATGDQQRLNRAIGFVVASCALSEELVSEHKDKQQTNAVSKRMEGARRDVLGICQWEISNLKSQMRSIGQPPKGGPNYHDSERMQLKGILEHCREEP